MLDSIYKSEVKNKNSDIHTEEWRGEERKKQQQCETRPYIDISVVISFGKGSKVPQKSIYNSVFFFFLIFSIYFLSFSPYTQQFLQRLRLASVNWCEWRAQEWRVKKKTFVAVWLV